MAYATAEQLAQALNIKVSIENSQLLHDCLDAAAQEIDHIIGATPIVNPPQGLLVRTNVNRGVEWYKATDTYNGGVGYTDIGVLAAPASGFERHAAVLLPLRSTWGLA